MSQKQNISNYFQCTAGVQPKICSNSAKKRLSLSLRKPTTPTKNPKIELQPGEVVDLCSSDEDTVVLSNTPEKIEITPEIFSEENDMFKNASQSTESERTVIYSLSRHSSICSVDVSPFTTPTKTGKSPKTSSSSSSSLKKFYSPTKKRMISKQPLNKVKKNLATSFSNTPMKSHISNGDHEFNKVCEGYSDKTIFLLTIINEYIKDMSMTLLMDEESNEMLKSILSLYKPGATVVCRLFWRRRGWYRRHDILDIANEKNDDRSSLGEDNGTSMLQNLLDNGLLEKGSEKNMGNIDDIAQHLLKLENLRVICKSLKLKNNSKKTCIAELKKCAQRTNIGHYFNGASIDNTSHILKLMRDQVGECYKLSNKAETTLNKLYVLFYIGIDYEYIREKKLEQMLIYEKIERETFPLGEKSDFDKPSLFFRSALEFEHYIEAQRMYEQFLTKDSKSRCELVQYIYNLYKRITDEQMQGYQNLPEWLRRFTPGHIYVKILEEGLVELKKSKNPNWYAFAVDILTLLIQQDIFRQHKIPDWYNEKALILHRYLSKSNEAATVLLEGLQLTNISEQFKDIMRPRALKIVNQKKLKLDEPLKHCLSELATKRSIQEGSLPSWTIHKQAMENTSKGKAKYETKSDGSRTIQTVEDYAMSCYFENGEFTDGGHWESKIIVNIFYLLFWDIIYEDLPNIRGIYLCRFQMFPLDLYSNSFYENRKELIDERLEHIRKSDILKLVENMESIWQDRPDSEVSELSRDLSFPSIRNVCRCLNPRGVHAVCRQLARHYRYWHSGFPDLTLYNIHTRKIKFVEVKSDNDKPSLKQIQWMQYLRDNGIDAEFCYVGSRASVPKSRKPIDKISS